MRRHPTAHRLAALLIVVLGALAVSPASGNAAAANAVTGNAAAGQAAAGQVAATKKGVSTWYFDGVTQALADVRVGWYHNWDSGRQNIAAPAGVEFVPTIWGAGSVTQARLDQARAEGSTLLGFNEPDLAEQANMSVERALELWPRLQSTGMRLGSPVVAHSGDVAGGWLDRFLSGAAARSLRVDFIALHWYGSDFSAAAVDHLRGYLQAVWDRYHKPIWLTEFALIDFSGATPRYPTQQQQVDFVRGATAMLNQLSYVERYAWFALPTDRSGTGLYNGTTPNAVGQAYRAVS
ncbi:glycoside hydrolase family protein [Goodfellowiella coeruleoviolacea]|uniref:Glycosyl hydrolase catalytic core n=1 Tax=Goodfellowiella coeruleoviolacea TaxID=334858 RepID=A0AAE3G8N4_9PSEU|nr:glycoside hydrolase family protein [Goodfellowiella coeruleoviolacea]MCP2163600.1 Glycosyl hydrolase catalytic core [Goodfellowiella coeruleoviolacea]